MTPRKKKRCYVCGGSEPRVTFYSDTRRCKVCDTVMRKQVEPKHWYRAADPDVREALRREYDALLAPPPVF